MNVGLDDPRQLELIYPQGRHTLEFVSEKLRKQWVKEISEGILEALGLGPDAEHQLVLGSIHQAAFQGDAVAVREHIKQKQPSGAEGSNSSSSSSSVLNAKDLCGRTALHLACLTSASTPAMTAASPPTNLSRSDSSGESQLIILKALLEAGADVHARDDTGMTALHLTAMQLQANPVSLLVKHGADTGLKDKRGHTPFLAAALGSGRDSFGHDIHPSEVRAYIGTLKALGRAHGRPRAGAHHMAADVATGMLKLAREGLSVRLQGMAQSDLDVNCLDGEYTLLSEACRTCSSGLQLTATARVLVREGVRINCSSASGRSTALDHLIQRCLKGERREVLPTILLLVSHGARIAPERQQAIVAALDATGVAELDAAAVAWRSKSGAQMPPMTQRVWEKGQSSQQGDAVRKCKLCGQGFTLFFRAHHCRACSEACCGNCSSKTISSDRVCDSCFNRACYGAGPQPKPETYAQMQGSSHLSSTSRSSRDHIGKRAELMGGNLSDSKAAPAVPHDERLVDSLQRTRGELEERGRALESLGDKSSQMVSAAGDFANMAKELRRQQQGQRGWLNF
ncbi:unnamed protein product [Chrysoparadoxa australica]